MTNQFKNCKTLLTRNIFIKYAPGSDETVAAYLLVFFNFLTFYFYLKDSKQIENQFYRVVIWDEKHFCLWIEISKILNLNELLKTYL